MSDQTLGSVLPPEADEGATGIERLLMQAEYSPKELAELVDIPLAQIEQDAFAGRLQATIVDHDIVSISRADAITWLRGRE